MIANRGGGAFIRSDDLEDRLRAAFEAARVEADIHLVEADGIAEAFADAVQAPRLDAVVAAGGDGTVSCAAGHLAGTQRPLGLLPLGTLNHLARDAGITADLDAAAAVIAVGHARPIDVAEVNGRVFVNNSGVGLYPDMVRFRGAEQEQGRSKRLAMLSASLRALRSFRRRRLWISAPGVETPIRTPLLFVGNNRYRASLFALGHRETLDAGELSLHAVRARSRAHLFWAGLRGLIGRLDQQRDFVTIYADRATISSDRPHLTISADGETFTMETPLEYRIRPKALRLIVPAPAPQ
ncbi:diacylglycerol/lipid kinase family protein [Sphingosinicella sp.]|uniref:diacylglycerol/lipid kinase family protein n=1 Tax=Sphingosinicella sp. TaxID=1917971 RepID=UPI0040378374